MSRSENRGLGKAVQDGLVTYTSVSAIEKFDEKATGGCERRWWYRYVDGKPEPQTASQTLGTQLHSELEHYLKTGENVLSPVALAGKHLLPVPGKDLVIEASFGEIGKAVALRKQMVEMDPQRRAEADRELWSVAGLVAAGVPLTGFIDLRHERGEYVDGSGAVKPEKPELGKVVEVVDHKTSSSIAKYAKSPSALLETTQMVGYARYVVSRVPDVRHIRLSHVYYQTSGAKDADKRTVLVSAQEAIDKWAKVEGLVARMQQTARAAKPEDIKPNLEACTAYGGCPHRVYCPKAPSQISIGLLGRSETSTRTGGPSMSLLDRLKKPAPAPVATQHAPASTQQATPAPVVSDAARRAEVEAAKQRLLAEEKVVAAPAVAHGPSLTEGKLYAVDGEVGRFVGTSKTPTGTFYFFEMADGSRARFTAAAVAGATVVAEGINPPDAPKTTLVEQADPIPAEETLAIADKDLRAKVEEHAKAHADIAAAKEAAAPVESKKESGRCPEGGKRVVLTADQLNEREVKCACGKPIKVKPAKGETGAYEATLPGHNIPKTEAPTVESVVAALSPERVVSEVVADLGGLAAREAAPVPALAPSPVVELPAFDPVLPPSMGIHAVPVAKSGAIVMVNVAVEGTLGVRSLESYYGPLVKEIEAKYGAADLRVGPKDGPLAFGGWKGVLAAVIRDNPPTGGIYSIFQPGEIGEVVIDALRPSVTLLRGVR